MEMEGLGDERERRESVRWRLLMMIRKRERERKKLNLNLLDEPLKHKNQYVERELVNHSNFCHPHVIQFKEAFLTPSHLGIAMEYAPGGVRVVFFFLILKERERERECERESENGKKNSTSSSS